MTDDSRYTRLSRGGLGRAVRTLLLALGWLLMLGAGALMALHHWPELQLTNRFTVLATAFIPVGILAWVTAGIIFTFAGRRWLKLITLVACAGMLLQVVWARPYWPRTPPVIAGPMITLLTLNLRCDEPALIGLVDIVERVRPDIVVLQDFSQEGWDYLQQTSWMQILPNHAPQPKDQPLAAGDDPCGQMVFSTAPVKSAWSRRIEQDVFDVDLPGSPVTVALASLPNVVDDVDRWLLGFDELGEAIRSVEQSTVSGAEVRPLLVVGDFNATREHLPLQRFIAEHDLADASEQAGAGWLPTFPANRRYPPLIAIDHILMSPSLAATEVTAFSVRYGAHRTLVARINQA